MIPIRNVAGLSRWVSTNSKLSNSSVIRYCRAGWEARGRGQCVACPPGMYRQSADRLCKLCPKGEFAVDFGSPHCAPCPRHHTTRGLGSRAKSDCYYHHSSRHNNNADNDISNSNRNNNYYNTNKNKLSSAKDRGRDSVPAPAVSRPTVVNGPRATTVSPRKSTTSLKKNRLGFMYYNMWNRRKSDNGARTASSDARSYGL